MSATKNLYILNIVILLVLSYFTQEFLLTEGVYHHSLGTQLSTEQIDNFLRTRTKWQWVGYVIIPIVYLVKIFIIAVSIYIIKIIIGKTFHATFSDISLAAVKADMVFLIPALIKIIWFTFNPAHSLEDIQYFMPGSIYQLFEDQQIAPWLTYPLQSFNIWEVAFWFILAFQLKEFFDNDFGRSFQNVMLSYGSGFLVWIVFVVFLTINFT
jgi:hypothetical protein